MTERINSQGLRPADTVSTRRSEGAKAAGADAKTATPQGISTTAGGTDTVNITRSALLLANLEEIVKNAPIVDDNRVAAVKDALAAGTYEIDDQRLADNLLRFERA
jgi:negative regulator of flagellin synthesis FlgM